MKKGFTLIELLIVMVVVGILVTIALPKYNASMERGRVMEALTNLQAASEVLNTRYVLNENNYTCAGSVNTNTGEFKIGNTHTGNFTKSVYFDMPKVTTPGTTCATNSLSNISVTTQRENGDYSLTACNKDGELKYIVCTVGEDAPAAICENVGAELTNTPPSDCGTLGSSAYLIDLRN